MDGNGRWATRRFLPRVAGHKQGVESLRRCVQGLRRPRRRRADGVRVLLGKLEPAAEEVSGLMELLAWRWPREVPQLSERRALHFVGDARGLSDKVQAGLARPRPTTAHNSRLVFNVCFNYGGRWDIAQAAPSWPARGEPITELSLDRAMALAHVPDPDLLIRTGGEQRISNFLLWQAAYSRAVFSDKLWPEFDEAALDEAIADFAGPRTPLRPDLRAGAAPATTTMQRGLTGRSPMLKQRVITAIVLLAILLPALFYRTPAFLPA
jgi:undecaprenyl diphosphate synthase